MAVREEHTDKVKKRLEKAFVQLFMERGYESITVNDLVEQAQIGRTTFYRYYESKADLLLSLHQHFFDHLQVGLATRAEWLSDDPSAALVMLFTKLQGRSIMRYSMYELGKDVDLIMRRMDELLAAQFEESVRHAFEGCGSRVPIPILAESIAALYSWYLRWWVAKKQPYTPHQVATFVHHAARAIVRDSIKV